MRCLTRTFGYLTIALTLSVSTVPVVSLSSSEQSRESDKEVVLAIVQDYLALSRAGQFEGINKLTIATPTSALKRQPSPSVEKTDPVEPGVAVVTGTALQKDNHLNWVRKDFPKIVAKDKKEFVRVDSIVVKDGFAKVAVNLSNQQKLSLLPWVFMLAMTEPNGRWKIFAIETPAYAVDYKP